VQLPSLRVILLAAVTSGPATCTEARNGEPGRMDRVDALDAGGVNAHNLTATVEQRTATVAVL